MRRKHPTLASSVRSLAHAVVTLHDSEGIKLERQADKEFRKRNWAEAKINYLKALEIYNKRPGIKRWLTNHCHLRLALIYLRCLQLGKAIRCCFQACFFPDNRQRGETGWLRFANSRSFQNPAELIGSKTFIDEQVANALTEELKAQIFGAQPRASQKSPWTAEATPQLQVELLPDYRQINPFRNSSGQSSQNVFGVETSSQPRGVASNDLQAGVRESIAASGISSAPSIHGLDQFNSLLPWTMPGKPAPAKEPTPEKRFADEGIVPSTSLAQATEGGLANSLFYRRSAESDNSNEVQFSKISEFVNSSKRHTRSRNNSSIEQLKSESNAAFNADLKVHTMESFDKAVEKSKALGIESETSLEMLMRDWFQKQSSTQALIYMRGTAIMAAALGGLRLDEGSRIDLASHADTKPRILKGTAYDFGGEATTWFRMSAGSLIQAQNYALGHKGLSVDGKVMDDQYVQQLRQLQKGIEHQLDIIYGAHDIKSVFEELKKQCRSNFEDLAKRLVSMKNDFDESSSKDSRYLAKCARDISLGYLAFAAYKVDQTNGEDARIMYIDAVRLLERSKELDETAPDNQLIESIAVAIRSTLQGAVDKQYADPFANPFNIPTPKYQ